MTEKKESAIAGRKRFNSVCLGTRPGEHVSEQPEWNSTVNK